MDSYLVRIYRRDEKDPKGITGTVVKIGTEKIHGFNNVAELGGIITGKGRDKGVDNKSGPGRLRGD